MLANHEITIDPNFVIETVRSPEKLETGEATATTWINQQLETLSINPTTAT
ncbi:MAG: hypothetical protein RMZ69_32265 [Nostoc sp. ChiQUE01a]|nr:hypothetical protein [Nostoc sp. DedQUE01]MDZ8241759.1 hypothetical protein [Nostoc sp. ChiQUE01a]